MKALRCTERCTSTMFRDQLLADDDDLVRMDAFSRIRCVCVCGWRNHVKIVYFSHLLSFPHVAFTEQCIAYFNAKAHAGALTPQGSFSLYPSLIIYHHCCKWNVLVKLWKNRDNSLESGFFLCWRINHKFKIENSLKNQRWIEMQMVGRNFFISI